MRRKLHNQSAIRPSKPALVSEDSWKGCSESQMATILRRAELSGWRRRVRLLGHPDFVWKRARVALFIDGCFWHGCPRCKKISTRHRTYWSTRIAINRKLDRETARQLRREGWKIVRVLECRIAAPKSVAKITHALGKGISRKRHHR